MTIELGTAPIDESLTERRFRALRLRNGGATFSEIAKKVGISPALARKDVLAAKRILMEETREELIAEHRSVVLDVRRAVYEKMTEGDIDSCKIVLSTLERESKLFGLDAPQRVALGVGTDVEFAETLASLIEVVGYRPPQDLVFAARGDRAALPEAQAQPSNTGDMDPVDVEEIEDDEDSQPSADTAFWSNVGHNGQPVTSQPTEDV